MIPSLFLTTFVIPTWTFPLSNSGNIGYKIRPSKRNLGYGNKILSLALEECKKIGMKKVVLHCYDYNEYSIKVIKNNNGVLTFKDNDIEIYEIKIGEEWRDGISCYTYMCCKKTRRKN